MNQLVLETGMSFNSEESKEDRVADSVTECESLLWESFEWRSSLSS